MLPANFQAPKSSVTDLLKKIGPNLQALGLYNVFDHLTLKSGYFDSPGRPKHLWVRNYRIPVPVCTRLFF